MLPSNQDRMWLTIVIVGLLLLSVGWIWISRFIVSPSAPTGFDGGIQKGSTAPEIVLLDLSGNEVSLADFEGKAVLLNFWASWCPPCRAEMPDLQRTWEEFKDRGGVVVAVNSTFQDSEKEALEFVNQNDLTFPVLLDIDGSVSRSYQVVALPTTIVLDRHGVICDIWVGGPVSDHVFKAQMIQLIDEGMTCSQ